MCIPSLLVDSFPLTVGLSLPRRNGEGREVPDLVVVAAAAIEDMSGHILTPWHTGLRC